jgi:hypothetical protein
MNQEIKYKYCCQTCEKTYIRKESLEKHKILCNYLTKTKREKLINNEESSDIPSYIDLVQIIQELALKYDKLQDKMINMEKWIEKKKKKIHVKEWLNKNRQPLITFTEWTINLSVNIKDIEYLIENTIFQTIENIWEKNTTNPNININPNPNNDSYIIPITCFSQKNNLIYTYNSNQWQPMKTEEFLYLLQKLQQKFLKALSLWHQDHLQEIQNNDSMSILYNKLIIKIMNISLTQDANYSKIHANLYNYIKMDLKSLIEYEFEF